MFSLTGLDHSSFQAARCIYIYVFRSENAQEKNYFFTMPFVL
jgi:hypothetical protein